MFKLMKRNNIILLVISVAFTLGVTLYYKNICSNGVCSYNLITGVISPIQAAGYYIAVISAVFLLLPAKYFNAWFKYVFIWAFPLSFVLVETLPVETGWLTISKTDIVQILGMIFGAITILFAAVQWFRSKK